MSKESKALEKKASQAWTSKRVFDMILNNALIIIMVIAVIYIAIRNPNFIRKASIINILSQTCAYLPVALGIGGCIVPVSYTHLDVYKRQPTLWPSRAFPTGDSLLIKPFKASWRSVVTIRMVISCLVSS